MTRKQFLLTVMGAVASLFGVTAVLGALAKPAQTASERPGYGEQNYGP